MQTSFDIRLATPADADLIAAMSRDYIEFGLGWRWTRSRVLANLRAPDVNLAVACRYGLVTGFGMMCYQDDDAHLMLLAVSESWRRQGVATALVAWLERCALIAGIGVVHLEARVSNVEALALYRRLGYRIVARAPGYYRGREDAIRMARDLGTSRRIAGKGLYHRD